MAYLVQEASGSGDWLITKQVNSRPLGSTPVGARLDRLLLTHRLQGDQTPVSTILHNNAQSTGSSDQETTSGGARDETFGSQSPNLQSQVNVLTNSISDEAVRLAVGKVLADLVFLLDYLSLVAGSGNIGGMKEVVSILNTVRCEAYSLAVFIEHRALLLEGLSDRLRETLDSSAYAINHEVRRIFKSDLANMSLDRDNQETSGSLLHA
jgi:hypothetical protein